MSKTAKNTLTLKEIQDRFQKAVMSGDDSIYDTILDNSRTSRATLFRVYAHAYTARLVDVLSNDFEAVAAYCGDQSFRVLAEAYIAAHPSKNQNVRWFGSGLPDFIKSWAPARARPEIGEIAQIEKAVADAFDAPDEPVAGIAGLACYKPEDWEHLVFHPHPSLSVFDTQTNAFEIWLALRDEAEPPAAEQPGETRQIAVWRGENGPLVRPLGPEESMLLKEAQRGVRFGVLCEMAATYDDPDTAAVRAAGYLQNWLNGEMLTRVSLESGRTCSGRSGSD